MLVWSLEPSAGEEWPDWLVPYAPKGRMHPLADGDVLEIPLTVVAQMGSPPTSSVTLVLRNTMLGGPAEEESRLLKFTFTRIVDYSTHPAKPPALCYHGMLARSPDPLVPDQCICSPGERAVPLPPFAPTDSTDLPCVPQPPPFPFPFRRIRRRVRVPHLPCKLHKPCGA